LRQSRLSRQRTLFKAVEPQIVEPGQADVMDKSRYGAALFALLFAVAIALLLTGEGLAR
jgi:hypothetical protein